MLKAFISSAFLILLSGIFCMWLFSICLGYTKKVISHGYFCSRTDTSYNVSIRFLDNTIEIINNRNKIQSFDYKKTISLLEKAKEHTILTSVLEKLRSKDPFNFKVDDNLKICGFYEDSNHFNEAYAYIGKIGTLGLFDIINNSEIGWLEKGKQDEDLVYMVIYLFVRNKFPHYSFSCYNDFIIIRNPNDKGIFRLDINYKKIFDIDLNSTKNFLIFEMSFINTKCILNKPGEELKWYVVGNFDPFYNSIASILGKQIDFEVEKCIYEENIKGIKKHLNIKDIKGNKEFMDLIKKVKKHESVKKLFPDKKQ